jgi:CheY-like chemotaxis protein
MLRILLIEDDPARIALFQAWCPEDVRLVVASSTGRAMGILLRDRGRVYAGILLDHDLQEQNITQMDRYLSGSDLIKVIVQNISRDVPVLVHSMNISRGPLMADQLASAGFMVTRIPMSVLTRRVFLEWVQEVRDVWETLEE